MSPAGDLWRAAWEPQPLVEPARRRAVGPMFLEI
jgi:hypothetical protein